VCALAFLWLFLIVLPLLIITLIITAISSPDAFHLRLSWDDRAVAETQSHFWLTLVVAIPCLALWIGAIWAYRALARIRELDGTHFRSVVLRRALFVFVSALLFGSLLSLVYKRVGIPKAVVAGFLTPGMGCWQLLVSMIPAFKPLVQSKSSIICVSVVFTAVFFSVLVGGATALHLRLKRVTPNA